MLHRPSAYKEQVQRDLLYFAVLYAALPAYIVALDAKTEGNL